MNVWTAFFLVVSIVILAAPLLFAWDAADRSQRAVSARGVSGTVMEDNELELELDLASGRLTREDYEAMTGKGSAAESAPDGNAEGDHENLPES